MLVTEEGESLISQLDERGDLIESLFIAIEFYSVNVIKIKRLLMLNNRIEVALVCK